MPGNPGSDADLAKDEAVCEIVGMLSPKDFVRAPGGGFDFGHVDAASAAAIGAAPGPIRLQQGYPGPKGYGNAHVESNPDRMRSLAQIGHTGFASFAYEVAQGYAWIGAGNPAHRWLLVYPKLCGSAGSFALRLIVEAAGDNGVPYFTIITGVFSAVARCRQICAVTRTGGSVPTPAAAVKQPRFETLSLPNRPKVPGGNGS